MPRPQRASRRAKGDSLSAAPRAHYGYIDGLRALLALYVVCVHTLPRSWGDAEVGGLLKLVAKCLSGGHLAVTAFIVVSGYCLAMPVLRAGGVLRGGAMRFYKRRYFRIAIPFYGAFLFAALLIVLLHGHDPRFSYPMTVQAFTPQQLIGNALLLQYFIPKATLDNTGPFWSIDVEFLIYFWFPLLILLWQRVKPAVATALVVVTAYAAFALLHHIDFFARLTLSYYAAFAIGTLAAAIAFAEGGTLQTWRDRIPWNVVGTVFLLFVVGVCAKLGWPRIYAHYIELLDLPLAIAVAATLIAAQRSPNNPVRRFLEFKPLEKIGLFSFSLYLLHFALGDVFAFVLNHFSLSVGARFACLLFVAIPLMLLIAWIFYRLVESKAHALARSVK